MSTAETTDAEPAATEPNNDAKQIDTAASSDAPAPGRSRRNRGSEQVRDRLVIAATKEFADHGFEGTSTRRIAEAADAHQSQIKYHFTNKDELWKQCLTALIEEVDAAITSQLATQQAVQLTALQTAPEPTQPPSPTVFFEATIRGLVHFAAQRPELNRIMMHEGTSPSERLDWLVNTHVRERQSAMLALWSDLQARGLVAQIDGDLVYHTVIGAASLLYSNAPEAVLFGVNPADPELVERHADSLVRLFLTPQPEP